MFKESNVFEHPEVLKQVWKDFTQENFDLVGDISKRLIEIIDEKEWAAISPQNIVIWDNQAEKDNFYKNIIILKNFKSQKYFQLINPTYKVISQGYSFMHELCWSIQTVDELPFWVLNKVPLKINVQWLDISGNNVNFILSGDTDEELELISFLIHEINHLNWVLISDGEVINSIIKGNPNLYMNTKKFFETISPSFLSFNGNEFIIHSIWLHWIWTQCNRYDQNKIIPFHFDKEYDFNLFTSHIHYNSKDVKISPCKKCFNP